MTAFSCPDLEDPGPVGRPFKRLLTRDPHRLVASQRGAVEGMDGTRPLLATQLSPHWRSLDSPRARLRPTFSSRDPTRFPVRASQRRAHRPSAQPGPSQRPYRPRGHPPSMRWPTDRAMSRSPVVETRPHFSPWRSTSLVAMAFRCLSRSLRCIPTQPHPTSHTGSNSCSTTWTSRPDSWSPFGGQQRLLAESATGSIAQSRSAVAGGHPTSRTVTRWADCRRCACDRRRRRQRHCRRQGRSITHDSCEPGRRAGASCVARSGRCASRQPAFVPSWFTAAAAKVFRTRVVQHREALRWDVRTRQILDQPAAQVLFANVRASIAECRLRPVLPFVDPQFLAALSREGGPLGFGGRGLVFNHLVGDVLPREVVFRSSKASFNETRWGDDEREFAREWDGTGFDPEWVDAGHPAR